MEFIEIAFVLLNYVGGLACIYTFYWLAFKNDTFKNKTLNIIQHSFFKICFALYCLFISILFFLNGLVFIRFLEFWYKGKQPVLEGPEDFVVFTILSLTLLANIVSATIFFPWYYYQKSRHVIQNRKILIRNTEIIFLALLTFLYLLIFSVYQLH